MTTRTITYTAMITIAHMGTRMTTGMTTGTHMITGTRTAQVRVRELPNRTRRTAG
jgi:hypothetical protein